MKMFDDLKVILFVALTLCCACSSDKNDVDVPEPASVQLSISTTIQTRAVMTSFSAGDRMNLYLKKESSVSSEDFVSGVSASLENGNWKIAPAVELKEKESAYLFAFYPYDGNRLTPATVSIDIASQTDYLYSGSAVPVSYSSPEAVLKMQHALSMLAFNISKQRYAGEGKLTSVKVMNLPVNGTLNVASGVISNLKTGDYTIASDTQIAEEEWTAQLPQMFCLPFTSDGQNIPVVFTIDGREYKTLLPKDEMNAGIKYVFHLVVTDNKIVVLADLTEKISLDKEGNNIQLGEYGILKITCSGNHVTAPLLSGSGTVSGLIYWGDNTSEPYIPPLNHNYSEKGVYELRLETWGASQLDIESLDGIESIDLSEF